jgi:hypothetical protein
VLVIIIMAYANVINGLKSEKLCSQCSKCDTTKCPATEDFPRMTAFDDTLIAGALQSDFVDLNDRAVYSVPNVKGGESTSLNAYFGWKSTSGSSSGYHRYAPAILILCISGILLSLG